MAKTLEILNNDYHIFRVKVPLVKGDTEGHLILSIDENLWSKLNWDEGTVLEIKQDDPEKQELTIKKAPRGLREQLGVEGE